MGKLGAEMADPTGLSLGEVRNSISGIPEPFVGASSPSQTALPPHTDGLACCQAQQEKFMMSRLDPRIARKLFLLVGSAVLGLLVFGVVSFTTLSKVKVGSPIANELRQHLELGGDLAPPKLDITACRLIVYRMLYETDHQKLQAQVAEFHEFQKAYADSHERWTKELPEGKLKEIVIVKIHEPAVKYFENLL